MGQRPQGPEPPPPPRRAGAERAASSSLSLFLFAHLGPGRAGEGARRLREAAAPGGSRLPVRPFASGAADSTPAGFVANVPGREEEEEGEGAAVSSAARVPPPAERRGDGARLAEVRAAGREPLGDGSSKGARRAGARAAAVTR